MHSSSDSPSSDSAAATAATIAAAAGEPMGCAKLHGPRKQGSRGGDAASSPAPPPLPDAASYHSCSEKSSSVADQRVLDKEDVRVVQWIAEYACHCGFHDLLEESVKLLPDDDNAFPSLLELKMAVMELRLLVEGGDCRYSVDRFLELLETIRPADFGVMFSSPFFWVSVMAVVRFALDCIADDHQFHLAIDHLHRLCSSDVDDFDVKQKRKMCTDFVNKLKEYREVRHDSSSSEYSELHDFFENGKHTREMFIVAANNFISTCEARHDLEDCFLSVVASEVGAADKLPEVIPNTIRDRNAAFNENFFQNFNGQHTDVHKSETERNEGLNQSPKVTSLRSARVGEDSRHDTAEHHESSASDECSAQERSISRVDLLDQPREFRIVRRFLPPSLSSSDYDMSVEVKEDESLASSQLQQEEQMKMEDSSENEHERIKETPPVSVALVAQERRTNALLRHFDDPVHKAVEMAQKSQDLESSSDQSRSKILKQKKKRQVRDDESSGIEERWDTQDEDISSVASGCFGSRARPQKNCISSGTSLSVRDIRNSQNDSYQPGQRDWLPEARTKRKRIPHSKSNTKVKSRRNSTIRAALSRSSYSDGYSDHDEIQNGSTRHSHRRNMLGQRKRGRLDSSIFSGDSESDSLAENSNNFRKNKRPDKRRMHKRNRLAKERRETNTPKRKKHTRQRHEQVDSDYSASEPSEEDGSLSETQKSSRPSLSRNRYRRWSPEDIDFLIRGVKRFGQGHWAQILNYYPFASYRTSIHLKDKWRNLVKNNNL